MLPMPMPPPPHPQHPQTTNTLTLTPIICTLCACRLHAQEDTLNIVMEYANAGDLAEVIQQRQAAKKTLQEDEIMFMWVGWGGARGCVGLGTQRERGARRLQPIKAAWCLYGHSPAPSCSLYAQPDAARPVCAPPPPCLPQYRSVPLAFITRPPLRPSSPRMHACRFVQIVLALFHVHSKNVLHRDLKSQNIFISEGAPDTRSLSNAPRHSTPSCRTLAMRFTVAPILNDDDVHALAMHLQRTQQQLV